ncbi:hypothetical protein DPMN_128829 [Dreissena polymorpha]|uniref:Uncharacterized protein n=1 Tax=Dreissena polymorpha TaxID=45954 RepID=A0A9D4H1Z5_DREPO|nr:hypothetical protein DPMN_128829 [Dreissena polymorpha]
MARSGGHIVFALSVGLLVGWLVGWLVGIVMGPCIVEIDRIVIREVQYQLDVNWYRNEEVIGPPGLLMGPCIVQIDRIIIREVQYKFEVNWLKCNFGWVWSMRAWSPRIDCIVIREFQGSSAKSVGGVSGQDERTDRRTDGDNHN